MSFDEWNKDYSIFGILETNNEILRKLLLGESETM